jgi:hypothetical protein
MPSYALLKPNISPKSSQCDYATSFPLRSLLRGAHCSFDGRPTRHSWHLLGVCGHSDFAKTNPAAFGAGFRTAVPVLRAGVFCTDLFSGYQLHLAFIAHSYRIIQLHFLVKFSRQGHAAEVPKSILVRSTLTGHGPNLWAFPVMSKTEHNIVLDGAMLRKASRCSCGHEGQGEFQCGIDGGGRKNQ